VEVIVAVFVSPTRSRSHAVLGGGRTGGSRRGGVSGRACTGDAASAQWAGLTAGSGAVEQAPHASSSIPGPARREGTPSAPGVKSVSVVRVGERQHHRAAFAEELRFRSHTSASGLWEMENIV